MPACFILPARQPGELARKARFFRLLWARKFPIRKLVHTLSEDGVVADGVLGATILHEATSMPLTLAVPDRAAERWFSLIPV